MCSELNLPAQKSTPRASQMCGPERRSSGALELQSAALSQPGTRRDLCVSHAKLAASDAATFAAEQAIQVFGGMGYTFEVDLHFFMKRAWALSGQWGDRSHHMARVEAAIIGGGCEIGPGPTFTHA